MFLDLDWGNHWVWSVRYENGDPDSFVPARVPAGLPKAYPERAIWGWPQRDDDWPSLLPSWSLQPVLLSGDETEGGEDDEREFWPGPIDLGRALTDVDGAVVPTRYYENQYDDGVLVRPYATFPHDWQAVRIATGLLRARHLRPVGGGHRTPRRRRRRSRTPSAAGRTARPRRSPGTGSPRTTATPSGSSSSTSSP